MACQKPFDSLRSLRAFAAVAANGANDRSRTDDLLITNPPFESYKLIITNVFKGFVIIAARSETK